MSPTIAWHRLRSIRSRHKRCPAGTTLELANVATRLQAMDDRQERLINWGYAICDVAMRKHVDASIAVPAGFPYPQAW